MAASDVEAHDHSVTYLYVHTLCADTERAATTTNTARATAAEREQYSVTPHTENTQPNSKKMQNNMMKALVSNPVFQQSSTIKNSNQKAVEKWFAVGVPSA